MLIAALNLCQKAYIHHAIGELTYFGNKPRVESRSAGKCNKYRKVDYLNFSHAIIFRGNAMYAV